MPRAKKLKRFLLIGSIVLLVVFVFLPVLGHAWGKRHALHSSVVPAAQWKIFISKAGKFRVLFPGSAQSTNVIVNNSATNLVMPCFFAWADRQTEYAVNYSDLPKTLQKLSFKRQFDICQLGVANEFGNIITQRDYTFNNFPARDFEFVVGGKGNFSGKVRLILDDERLYQVMVIFLTKNPHPDDFKIFFDSFSVAKDRS